MKRSFFFGILFFFVCFNPNAFSSANDTIFIKCSGQSCTTIVPLCSCPTNSSLDDLGFDIPSSDFTNINPSLPVSPFINIDSPSIYNNKDSVLPDTNNVGFEHPSEVVSLITLIVNDFNNVLSEINNSFTLISIIIGIFGLLIGVLGILGFSNLKTDYRELKKGLAEQICEQNNKIQKKNNEIDEILSSVKESANLLKQHNYQIEYLQRINQSLFSITNSVVDSNGGNDETASSIRNSLYNQYYIVKAFLPWSDSPTDGTEAAFRYLQVQGTKDNIDDLQFIANNDPDERKKKIAGETIGFIRARYDSGQA